MRRVTLALVLAVLVACGGGTATPAVQLSLGPTYDVAGVARILPDGTTPASLAPIFFRYEAMASSGGRVVGKLTNALGAQTAIAGEFDPEMGDFSVEPLTFALSGTTTTQITELGGRGFDGTPPDRIIDDMSGYLRLEEMGTRRAIQTYTVAASRAANAPPAPDPTKLSSQRISLGLARVTGAPGAIFPRSAVELFVHPLAITAPTLSTAVSDAQGAFMIEIEASEGDMILVRARNVGIAGDARTVVVGP